MTAPSLSAQIQGVGAVTADNYNTFAQTADNIAQLRAFVGLPGIEVQVRGLVTPNDGGAGLFYWLPTLTATDDGVNYIAVAGSNGGGWIRNTLSGAFGLQATIASASTTDIGSLGSNNIYITGGVTINSLGITAKSVNPVFLLRFQSSLTIKNSSSIICPNGNDITTQANSVYLAQALGSGVFVVTAFSAGTTPPPTYPGFGSQNSLATASTADLGTIATHNVLLTGTTTVTSFGSSASATAPIYLVESQSAFTLTYNATSMQLIGNANISVAAGDSFMMNYLRSGNWNMLFYQRANGTALTAKGQLQSQPFTSSGSFTIPVGTTTSTAFRFTVIGGGGGGGGAATGSSGGGGGSGQVAIAELYGFTVGQAVTVTIGSGGSAGSTSGSNGTGGGTSSLTYASVAFITCTGGAGGGGGVSISFTGYGGSTGTATLNLTGTGLTALSSILSGGQCGENGNTTFLLAGHGGGNLFGSGGNTAGNAPGVGGAGTNGGGGGGGNGNTASAGGTGATGFVLVEWIQ
jgi:hypothetical protein